MRDIQNHTVATTVGALALAAGTLAAPAAHAVVVSYNVDQTLPGTVKFNNIVQFNAGNGVIGTSSAGTNLIEVNGGNAVKNNSGTSVGPALFTMTGTGNQGGSSGNLGGSIGTGPGGVKIPFYVALDVHSAQGENYGYAEFSGGANPTAGGVSNLTATDLIGYAFETALNTPITTVDLTPPAAVPEPASLALLAMGVAGVTAIRRRARA